MRALFTPEFLPAIHYSSFDAGRALPTAQEEEVDPLLHGFLEQTRHVLVGVQAAIDRSLEEGWSMVIEGRSPRAGDAPADGRERARRRLRDHDRERGDARRALLDPRHRLQRASGPWTSTSSAWATSATSRTTSSSARRWRMSRWSRTRSGRRRSAACWSSFSPRPTGYGSRRDGRGRQGDRARRRERGDAPDVSLRELCAGDRARGAGERPLARAGGRDGCPGGCDVRDARGAGAASHRRDRRDRRRRARASGSRPA